MKKRRNSQRYFASLTGIVLSILTILQPACAQPVVKLRAEPDLREIRLGEFAAIKFSVDVAQDATFTWSCAGHENCTDDFREEETIQRASRSYYFLPKRLGGQSAAVNITVAVTDLSGNRVQDSLQIRLLASAEELLELADEYFNRERWTTPKGENAFDLCREILSIDPENDQAREVVYKIEDLYKAREEKARKEGDIAELEDIRTKSLRVSRYIETTFSGRKKGQEEGQQFFCDALTGEFEAYKELRVRELQGENLNDEILETIEIILDILAPDEREELASAVSADAPLKESEPKPELQVLRERFELAHKALESAQNDQEKILQTLKILEILRELKGCYSQGVREEAESLTRLENTINRYEEEFLSE